jgi:ribosomal protein S6--L-glutamate ligase
MEQVSAPFILGRTEWVALPALGLFAIKAKVDTGAKTSALHAHTIEAIGTASAPEVRFEVHPIPERPDIAISCSAPIIGQRDVTSSNGETESRYIIETRIRIGSRDWTIELGLTNREGLTHRMLLGRQAIQPGMLVDPASSFRQPKLSPRLYRR